MGNETVFENGSFILDVEKELTLSDYLSERMLDSENKTYPAHDLTVDIDIRISRKGKGFAVVTGSDLSYGYVRENADYRS
jgi:N-acetylglutamate synthase/N-acetylornithine aminotransferase